jgi:hypothetical protein
MDPVSLIVAALAAGLAAAVKESAGDAVKVGYQRLKSLILGHSGDNEDVKSALEKHEQKPEVWTAPLKDALVESGADKDQEVVQAAHELAKLVDPQAAHAFEQYIENYGQVGMQINIGQVGQIGGISGPTGAPPEVR